MPPMVGCTFQQYGGSGSLSICMDDFYYIEEPEYIPEFGYDESLYYDEDFIEIIDGEFVDEAELEFPLNDRHDYWEQTSSGLMKDPLIVVSLLMAFMVVFFLVRDRVNSRVETVTIEGSAIGGVQSVASSQTVLFDPEMVESPYDHYTLTQGPHGFSYGHKAIDISAGKGAQIKSPINGEVTGLFVDYLGNTVLELENSIYKVTFLHGIYNVKLGEAVKIGQVIGKESNQGNTFDMAGRSCRGRNCGYHTHLNIFDKRLGSNVNPLGLIK